MNSIHTLVSNEIYTPIRGLSGDAVVASRFIAQSAEKGSWPEVMCATQSGLEQQRLYGPTKRAQTVGAIGMCPLDKVALDETLATKLWSVSEEKTSFNWAL
ncbi:hypothetical protein EI164_07975 [Psychrobacter sp. FME13]|uniref:hypothetical protein n=4 Tax=Psychrobacter TaxID=497 RepID=UPI001787A097|nr:hypothetical protein [Psychrobacter sp. FME13]MBE0441996.1 hypothetical protein [Psychrobacter sp. FME13]